MEDIIQASPPTQECKKKLHGWSFVKFPVIAACILLAPSSSPSSWIHSFIARIGTWERERERDHKLGWQFLLHATFNDWERNWNECRNIRPQQKAKKNALETFTKFLIKMGNAEIQTVIVKEEPLHVLSSSSSRWIVKALKICNMKFLKTADAWDSRNYYCCERLCLARFKP